MPKARLPELQSFLRPDRLLAFCALPDKLKYFHRLYLVLSDSDCSLLSCLSVSEQLLYEQAYLNFYAENERDVDELSVAERVYLEEQLVSALKKSQKDIALYEPLLYAIHLLQAERANEFFRHSDTSTE